VIDTDSAIVKPQRIQRLWAALSRTALRKLIKRIAGEFPRIASGVPDLAPPFLACLVRHSPKTIRAA
jgi:hypothetical protein